VRPALGLDWPSGCPLLGSDFEIAILNMLPV
jgi:hypothetical protein